MHVAGTTCPEQYLHCLPVDAGSVIPLPECHFHILCYTLFDSYYCFLIQTLIELFIYLFIFTCFFFFFFFFFFLIFLYSSFIIYIYCVCFVNLFIFITKTRLFKYIENFTTKNEKISR